MTAEVVLPFNALGKAAELTQTAIRQVLAE
jgi:hypothetical protein